jgi:hypothetical protein
MITVHHLNNSRSQRVLWLLEELGVEYDVKRYERDPNTMLAPPALRAVHPLGKSPVIATASARWPSRAPSLNIWSSAMATAGCSPLRAHPNDCATPTGCTTPRGRRCRRC